MKNFLVSYCLILETHYHSLLFFVYFSKNNKRFLSRRNALYRVLTENSLPDREISSSVITQLRSNQMSKI